MSIEIEEVCWADRHPATDPFGIGLTLTYSRPRNPMAPAELTIESGDGSVAGFLGAVDDGETVDFPRSHLLLDREGDHLFVFGGEIAWALELKSPLSGERIELFRERVDDEYWYTKIWRADSGVLMEYEAGLMLLSNSLRVLWHRKKMYNECVIDITPDEIWLVEDHDRRLAVQLTDGRPSPDG